MPAKATAPSGPDEPPSARSLYRRRHRLSGSRAYTAVHQRGVRKPRGPIIVVGLPNDLPHCRLGLSVSRHVGGAVRRNRIKRRVREAFRLLMGAMPTGYDLVIIVRLHEPLSMTQYRELLASAWTAIDATWRKRRGKHGEGERWRKPRWSQP